MAGKSLPCLICVFTFSMIALTSCDDPQGPQTPYVPPQVTIDAKIKECVQLPSALTICADQFDAIITVVGALSIPSVTVNDITCELSYSEEDSFIFRYDDFPIAQGDSAHLRMTCLDVNSNYIIGEADVIVPGQFVVTPQDTTNPIIFQPGSELTITWTSSAGADVYGVHAFLICSFYDTLGIMTGYYSFFDSLLQDTAFTLQSTDLFVNEEEIDSLFGGWGCVYVNAQCGPWQEGVQGNVMTSARDTIGCFKSETFGGLIFFDLVDLN